MEATSHASAPTPSEPRILEREPLVLNNRSYSWITNRICDIADRHAGGRVVSALEGGYDLDALAASTAAHVKTLMERGA